MAARDPERPRALFDGLSFVVVRSTSLSEVNANKLLGQIELHGGDARLDPYPESRIDLDGVTHIIATTFDFQDHSSAADRFLPVIKPAWIDASVGSSKLANPRRYSPDPRLFMSDVVATCADLPEGDAEAIDGGVLAMGGNYSLKLTSQVTHIVALTMDNDKVQQAKLNRLSVRVVLPHWFDDCLKLGKKIDEGPYLLPEPEIMRGVSDKAPIGRANKHVASASSPDPSETLPEGPKSPVKRKFQVARGKTFLLERDLAISQYLRGVLTGMIESSGGKITDSISEADFLVCKYRDGDNYKIASQAGIDVGNLAWIYHMIIYNEWTSPFRRLLHYPVSREPIPGFEGLKISLSNYSGEARTYLENLIKATGAECTKTLRQENTHLITAHTLSEKVSAARDWNINVINHLWLEESYAKWQMQNMTLSRYTHFPSRTNLGEVVGQTQLDREVLERKFFPTPLGPGTGVKRGTENKTNMLDATSRKSNARSGQNTNNDAYNQTPIATRFVSAGKENVTPGTTGSRKSKDAAAAKLHSLTADMELYEKEKKRAGGVVYGGRRKSGEERDRTDRKRSVDALDQDMEEEPDSAKKQKKSHGSVEMHLLVTGYKRWVGKAREEDADIKKLRGLGVVVTTEPTKATHVAVPHIIRTAKLVVALAHGPVVLSTDFIEQCLHKDRYLDPAKFKLQETDSKNKIGVSLDLVRERARNNRQQLLSGRSVYCVDKIHGGFEIYQAIVEANGGSCMTFRGRHTTMTSHRAGSDGAAEEDPQSEVYLLSSSSKEDARLWARFSSMAENSRKTPRIVSTDWLLNTAMRQEIQPVEEYLLGS